MKNIDVPIGTVLPITDAFFMRLLTANHINGDKVLVYVEEEGREGYSTSMWLDYMRQYGRVARPCEEVYRGILIQPVSDDMLEATLLAKE